MAKAKRKRSSPKRITRIRNKRTAMGKKVVFRGKHALAGFESFGWPVESTDAPSKVIRVKAAWDAEAKVWYTAESSLPGLHIEANSLFELYNKLPGAIEDLLEGSGERKVLFEFIALGHATIPA
jgi:uncharacterized protein DUF1902